jgi:hypothetical protein
MADRLKDEEALGFARRLKGVLGFPWDDDVIKAHADHIQRWCRGYIAGDRVYPAWSQADWLLNEVELTWKKWLGTSALKELFDSKFKSKILAGNEARPLGQKPPIECSSCNDTGIIHVRGKHRYCDCQLGERIKEDSGENGKKWLALMDKSFFARPTEPTRRRPNLTLQELEAEYLAQKTQDPEQP